MLKKEIEAFLLQKQGYLKKSPLKVAKAIWKSSNRMLLPKTREAVNKELNLIKDIQKNLRLAKSIEHTVEDTFLLDTYQQIVNEKNRPKRRLFFDIEVSPDIVLTWGIGNKISISHDSIIQERAIICICWKWADEEKVYSLKWEKGDDKEMLQKFAKVMDSADEVIGQNSDNFDIKWVRTRCLYHGIPISPKFNSLDTLKMARAGFRFNANRLDYMGKFLGYGGKVKTDYDMWKDILLKNDTKAMTLMVDYCKEDVILLEKVYNRLQEYCPVKKFKYKF